jgi:uncharacterized protein (TIGR02996 family)
VSIDAARAGFLAAIIAEPEDDSLRLIFADWIEDHGEPERAEFVRVQLELARIGHMHPLADDEDRRIISRAKKLRRREQELSRQHHLGIHFFACEEIHWSRGFVSRVRLTCADWVGEQCARCANDFDKANHYRCILCHGAGRVNASGPPSGTLLPHSLQAVSAGHGSNRHQSLCRPQSRRGRLPP